jgi:hypothetical protein
MVAYLFQPFINVSGNFSTAWSSPPGFCAVQKRWRQRRGTNAVGQADDMRKLHPRFYKIATVDFHLRNQRSEHLASQMVMSVRSVKDRVAIGGRPEERQSGAGA